MLVPRYRCERCGKPREGGRGKGRIRYCPPCSTLSRSEAQERAMERFKDANPEYWANYYQRGKA